MNKKTLLWRSVYMGMEELHETIEGTTNYYRGTSYRFG
jgi:hypothetical protein